MTIAITVWGNRISPVFEASKTLLVVEITGGEIVCKAIKSFCPTKFDSYRSLFQALDVQLLLCGAICGNGINSIEASGVEVIPFLTGEVENVLQHFINGKEIKGFVMPGCPVRRCCKRVVMVDGAGRLMSNGEGEKV
ncbi:MAG: NifB/NifX family molybdenum-iron cluster-binding protein [Desulforhopalus sp.]